MGGVLLSSGELTRYRPLGAVGLPVHAMASQIRAAVARHLGVGHADMLAVPQMNETGTRIDWYAAFTGPVVPWSAATEDERRAALVQIDQTLMALGEHAATLAATTTGEPQVFARQLALAGNYPEPDCVFLVDGRPVLTFWGFAPLPVAAAPAILPPPPPAAAVPVASARRARPWWILLLLPLLLLPLLFLKTCGGCAVTALGDGKPEQVMVVLDTSLSMGLPMGMSRSEAGPLLEATAKGDIEAIKKLKTILAANTTNRRIDAAKGAMTKVAERLPEQVELGVVTFGACRNARRVGVPAHSGRTELIEAIRAIQPQSGTPLAEGLQVAAAELDGIKRPAAMVVISDGAESCSGDPCATARQLKQDKPKLTIHVIDVTGDGAATCIARETGGRVLTPVKAEEFDMAVATAAEGGCP